MSLLDSRELSRKQWTQEYQGGPSQEQISAGSLQRIADAAEKMAANYTQAIKERDQYRDWWKQEQRYKDAAHRSNRALRGVITKLRRENDKLKGKIDISPA